MAPVVVAAFEGFQCHVAFQIVIIGDGAEVIPAFHHWKVPGPVIVAALINDLFARVCLDNAVRAGPHGNGHAVLAEFFFLPDMLGKNR